MRALGKGIGHGYSRQPVKEVNLIVEEQRAHDRDGLDGRDRTSNSDDENEWSLSDEAPSNTGAQVRDSDSNEENENENDSEENEEEILDGNEEGDEEDEEELVDGEEQPEGNEEDGDEELQAETGGDLDMNEAQMAENEREERRRKRRERGTLALAAMNEGPSNESVRRARTRRK